MVIKAGRDFIAALKDFEKGLAEAERRRKYDLLEVKKGGEWPLGFRHDAEVRAAAAEMFKDVEGALANSRQLIERFSKQAEKDEALIEKLIPALSLSPQHPFLKKKLALIRLTEQKLEQLQTEIENMRAMVKLRIELADASKSGEVEKVWKTMDGWGEMKDKPFYRAAQSLTGLRSELEKLG